MGITGYASMSIASAFGGSVVSSPCRMLDALMTGTFESETISSPVTCTLENGASFASKRNLLVNGMSYSYVFPPKSRTVLLSSGIPDGCDTAIVQALTGFSLSVRSTSVTLITFASVV